jgi:hypothetical protein
LYNTHSLTGALFADSTELMAGDMMSSSGSASDTPDPLNKVRRGMRYELRLIRILEGPLRRREEWDFDDATAKRRLRKIERP